MDYASHLLKTLDDAGPGASGKVGIDWIDRPSALNSTQDARASRATFSPPARISACAREPGPVSRA